MTKRTYSQMHRPRAVHDISARQCAEIWEVFARHFGVRTGAQSKLADFMALINGKRMPRYDLKEHGAPVLFLNTGIEPPHVITDQEDLALQIAAANAEIRAILQPRAEAA